MTRADDLAANLAAVRRRIADACDAAGRSPDDVSLVVVTKFFPASDVRALADLGVTDVGENRHQEASDKAAECADLGLRWHFIGALQSNKAAAVASYADVVESVDRAKLVGAARPGCGGPHGRRAAPGQPRPAGLRTTGPAPTPPPSPTWPPPWPPPDHLRLRGLMAVAPLGEDPAEAFARLADIRAGFLADHPRRHRAVGRDERRPRAGDRPRRDTRACRVRGPRSEACGQVMSTSVKWRPDPGARSTGGSVS